jgi:hypothetical protein
MKVLAITLALAGLASTATLNAQVVSNSRVTGTTQGAILNGSWSVVGSDRMGQIYERRIQDRNGNVVVQRARRGADGNLTVISSQTVGNVNINRNNGCAYNRTTNSVGDIIFGRANANTCDDVNSRDDGAWYQVGQGENNNSIYERRTVDARGNLVIQRGRRNPNGTFTILSTRIASRNDKQWKRAQKQQERDWKKGEKERDKEWKKHEKSDDKQMKDHDNHG